MSSFVKGVGDLILFAGAATESITSSTAGVAEDAVRIVEDVTHRLAAAVEPYGENPLFANIDEGDETIQLDEYTEHQTSYISYGTRIVTSDEHQCSRDASERSQDESRLNAILMLCGIAISWLMQFIKDATADTSGVPSLVPQLVGVTIIVYLMSLSLLGKTSPKDKDGSKTSASTF